MIIGGHETLSVNYGLIIELFDRILYVLGIRYHPRILIPTFASSKMFASPELISVAQHTTKFDDDKAELSLHLMAKSHRGSDRRLPSCHIGSYGESEKIGFGV